MFNINGICPILSRIQIPETATGVLSSIIKRGSLGWISHLDISISMEKIAYITYRVVFYRFGTYGKYRITPVDIGPIAIKANSKPVVTVESYVVDIKSLSNEALLSYILAAEMFLSYVTKQVGNRNISKFFLRPGTALHTFKECLKNYEDDPSKVIGMMNPVMVERVLTELRMYQTYSSSQVEVYAKNMLSRSKYIKGV